MNYAWNSWIEGLNMICSAQILKNFVENRSGVNLSFDTLYSRV